MGDWKDAGLAPSTIQPPIVFGGVRLPAMEVGSTPDPGPEKPVWLDAQPGPAGEGSPEARILTVSRWALAARIKHGVPLSEMLGHIQTLALLEERLTSYQQ